MRERIANEGSDKNKNSSILPFNAIILLIFIIGISLLSLSVSIPMINAQTASVKILTDGAQMMGTCVVGVESPCNGTQWSR
jgi:hypothetical protein